MNTAVVGSEGVDLLSRITGQKLNQRDLTPPVTFLAALITVILGLVFADGTLTDEKKQRLQVTLNRLNLQEAGVRQLAKLMLRGVQQQKVYRNIDDLLTLTAPLSEAERLLLIGFGYEMSAADGAIAPPMKKYLQAIANRLGINPQHLAVLEAGFSNQGTVEPAALDEVRFLLDPAQFQSLDAVFVKAASDMLTALHGLSEHQAIQQHTACSYSELKKFQEYRKQLDNHCYQLFQIIQECNNRGVLPHTLTEEIGKVSHKLRSQRFRVAVVGEFSQGKSTLLNALLGAEIQPVRAIPCSGVVTVLRYGAQKRVVCRYRDGREEEIPFNQYQVKVAISEEAALSSVDDELAQSEIDEIVFEHPDFELCRSGVEIVDSPGLNEHCKRTEITEKLVKDTDAVIFLANASRPLTQWERDYLTKELRTQLNGGRKDEPADNLFVLVNFMDLLRRDKDRQDVRQRIERFLQGQNPVIAGENRVHFISAQAALDAILGGSENEYLKTFHNFTQSIEKFLTIERGSLEISQPVSKIKGLIQAGLHGLHRTEEVLDEKLKLSEAEKQKILEHIGEASGHDVKLRLLADKLIAQVIEPASKSWDDWRRYMNSRVTKSSIKWSSEHHPVWSQDKLIQDYINQFNKDLLQEINDWGNIQLMNVVLKPRLDVINEIIFQELQAIRAEFISLEQQVPTDFGEQLNLGINGVNANFIGERAFWGGIGVGSAFATTLFLFTGIGLVPIIIASVAAAIAGEFGPGILGFDGISDQVKRKVIEIGFKKFDEAQDQLGNKRNELIHSVINHRVESASQVIAQAISFYEALLEQQEKSHQETLKQCELEKAWLSQKREELNQVQNNVEVILNQCPG